MPAVPYSPVPSVVPSTSVPNDYQNIQASPDDFGAQIGRAEQGLGSTLKEAGAETSATALQYQNRANNIAADHAFNTHQQNVQYLLYGGDPDHPENLGYYGLHGQAAMDARPGVLQALEQSRVDSGASLNAAAALSFNEATRRLNMLSMSDVGRHYEQEFTRYAVETQTAGIDIKARAVANQYNDNDLFLHNLEDARRNADAKSALTGADPGTPHGKDIFANNRMQAEQTLYTSRAVAMGNADPAAAYKFLKDNVNAFDAITFHKLEGEFKAGAEKAQVAAGVASVSTTPASTDPTQPRGLRNNNPLNLEFRDGQGATSSDGRFGVYPTMSDGVAANARQLISYQDNRGLNTVNAIIGRWAPSSENDVGAYAGSVAKSMGVSPDAPVNLHDPKVMASLITGMSKVENGGKAPDPTAISQGVDAAISRTPIKHDPAPFGLEFQQMQTARQKATELFPDRPDLQRSMVEGVWQNIQQTNTLQAKYEAEQAKATRDAQEASGQTVIKQIFTDPKSFDPAALANDPNLTWEQKNSLFNVAQKHLGEVAGGKEAQTYGPGFWNAYQQVHSSDPSAKINDPSQLWARGGPGGDLTLSGIEKLTQEITSSRNPEGAAQGAMTKDYLAAAHVAISGHGMFGGQRDAVGEMNFARFVPLAFAEIEREKQAGMTPAQMMAKGGDLDKLVQQNTRSSAQMMKDMLASNNPDLPGTTPAAPTAPAGKLDLNTSEGIVSAYKSGHFGVGPAAYDRAATELMRRGFVKAPPAATPAPSAPTDER